MNLKPFLLFMAGFALKLLLIPSYHSTDFDVHRNWLAITHQLPISKWYFDTTSQWTLDYPPFFAWFEWLLSWPAYLFDPEMLQLQENPYISPATLIFQRLSVMLSDIFLWGGLLATCTALYRNRKNNDKDESITFILAYFLPALLLVDHIHFQYNGMVIGICLFPIVLLHHRKPLLAVALLAFIVNLKHLYISILPAFALYVFKNHCFNSSSLIMVKRILAYFLVVLAVFSTAYLPFIVVDGEDQLKQIFARLFPFERGLMHAYWAPNVWAIYTISDKVLSAAAGLAASSSSSSHGIVGEEYKTGVLPGISPSITLSLWISLLIPILAGLWKRLNDADKLAKDRSNGAMTIALTRAVMLCNFSFFMVSWHVHEKASLISVILQLVLAGQSRIDSHLAFIMANTATYSMFPLINLDGYLETPVRMSLLVFHLTAMLWWMQTKRSRNGNDMKMDKILFVIEMLFVIGLFASHAIIYYIVPHTHSHLPFLPLMLTSLFCSVCMMYAFIVHVFSEFQSLSRVLRLSV